MSNQTPNTTEVTSAIPSLIEPGALSIESTAIEMMELPPPDRDEQPPAFIANATALSSGEDLPPDYGPIPSGTVLLAVVPLNFNKAPAFFNNVRPTRLEDKISNLTYLNRMNELNTELCKPANRKSMQLMTNYGMFVLIASIVCLLIGYGTLLANSKYAVYTVVLVAIPFLMVVTPWNPKYVRLIDIYTKKWTKEDEILGINLQYAVNMTRSPTVTQLHIKILIFERQAFSGDQNMNQGELPTYSD
ncbi:UNVERIFIED_CONTAM: hypothetical protein HDU68_010616 [Siphonaria sp. JEL0065]|nr:hypothetical protein HDU68_010616 [Siphonaria sp. JEL0065]